MDATHDHVPAPSSTPRSIRPDRELLTAWLLLLVQAGTSYGYHIRRELAARQLDVDAGNVYRALRQLQREGQLRSRWGKTVAGPRRRLYHITPEGQRNLAEIAARITALRDSHDRFLEAHAETVARRQGGAAGVEGSSTSATVDEER